MRGSVRAHGAAFQYRFSITRAGKRVEISEGGFGTKRDAWDACRARQQEFATGRAVTGKGTFKEWLEREWLPNQATKKPKTREGYRYWVERRIVPELGAIALRDLTAGDIATFYAKLRGAHGRLDGKPGGLAERSVKQAHAVLHRSLDAAVAARRLARNPMADLDRDLRPKIRRSERSTWTPSEVGDFLRSVGDRYPYRALFQLAVMTGMTRSELLGLRWSDVDLDGATVSIVRGLTAAEGELWVGEPKTDNRARRIDVDAVTVAVLRRYRAAQLEVKMANRKHWNADGVVFSDRQGDLLQPDSVSQAFERARDRARMRPITFHDLRHTHATILLEGDVHPKVVSERLGHGSVAITLDIYSHVTPAMRSAAAAVAAEAVFGPPSM